MCEGVKRDPLSSRWRRPRLRGDAGLGEDPGSLWRESLAGAIKEEGRLQSKEAEGVSVPRSGPLTVISRCPTGKATSRVGAGGREASYHLPPGKLSVTNTYAHLPAQVLGPQQRTRVQDPGTGRRGQPIRTQSPHQALGRQEGSLRPLYVCLYAANPRLHWLSCAAGCMDMTSGQPHGGHGGGVTLHPLPRPGRGAWRGCLTCTWTLSS